jgi:hypothetical protein
MGIKAGNIITGKTEEPKKAPSETKVFGGISAKNINIVGDKPIEEKTNPVVLNGFSTKSFVVENKPQPTIKKEPVIPEKYIVRKDGDLIMNLNTKSDYLRDVLDLD